MGTGGRRICVTGGREFADRKLVERTFREISLSQDDTVIEGEARGADRLCADVARQMGAVVEPHPARWGLYGNRAGILRNIEMLQSGADMLLSFPGGRGTKHCTDKAREMGIPVVFALPDETTSANPPVPESVGSSGSDGGEGTSPSEDPWGMLVNPLGHS